MVSNIFLALGSNKGDRLNFISEAINKISENENCGLVKVSSIYETTPYGLTAQENFFNAAIEIKTSFTIEELYYFVKEVERKTGRMKSSVHQGPREIDVDIIFYNNLIYNSDKLTVPHKDSLKRDFVMTPLIEIASEFVHPILNKKLCEIDLSLIERHIICKIKALSISPKG
ncbi:MAG: 2-amino-4-hydroxy-6-hydroxymethyldihydropteridine diphosphokinase [Bacteroidota bacterium]